MKILGIGNATDSGATLIIGNEIVAAANEERFTRRKLYRGFPWNSINYVLKEGGISLSDLDFIASGCWKGPNVEKVLPLIVEKAYQNPAAKDIMQSRINASLTVDKEHKAQLYRELKKNAKKLVFVDHHQAHAHSAFYCSPFDEALVLTADGRGDFRSMTLSIASRSEGIKELDCLSEFDSLGYFYAIITKYLGFKPMRHEGKITGLAAYGDPNRCLDIIKKMFKFKNGRPSSNLGGYYAPTVHELPPKLVEELKGHQREDVAAAAQMWLEYLITSYLARFVKEYRIENICLAGGVFANVKVNQRIMEIDGVSNVYIHPHMGDGGIGTGAALSVLHENGGEFKKPLKYVYLGPEFSDKEIEAGIKKFDLKYEIYTSKEKIKLAAELISEGKAVGWFQGRMEYGPRALGNRSILYMATRRDVNDYLNKRLHRSEFMPFAPVTLAEEAKECYKNWGEDHFASKFMTITYDCTEKMKKECPGVVHVDNTARPQVIWKEDNPEYYDVVNTYFKKTGLPSVINTSYNDHEEPIVCTPEDALDSYKKGNVDVAILGDYVVGL